MRTTSPGNDLQSFVAQLRVEAGNAAWGRGADLVVGVSGGIDSMTLLYLLRFEFQLPSERIHVAHLDHGMRPGSPSDAEWLAGVCKAWGVPYHRRAALPPIRTESQGREARYRFFHDLAAKVGATAILTGHNADDQAETVLFRIARGAGPTGLVGVRSTWSTGVVRPLLQVWRRQIEELASARRIPYRDDPTNADPTWSRNRLRHEVLPLLNDVVPGASSALVALSRMAESERRAMSELTDSFLEGLMKEDEGPYVEVEALQGLSNPVLTQLVRRLGFRMGVEPGRKATAQAVSFIRESQSGQRVDLGGGMIIDRSFGRIRFRPGAGADAAATSAKAESETGEVPTALIVRGREGSGRFKVGRRIVEVRWGGGPFGEFTHRTSFARSGVPLPLTVRRWRDGDRVRMSYGTKKVKKLLAEKRVPYTDRNELAVVADGEGDVVWVPGVAHPGLSGPDEEGERLYVGIRYSPQGDGQ